MGAQKEFKKQSIEYDKKLQDQIEKKNSLLDQMKLELEGKCKDLSKLKEEYLRETESFTSNISNINDNLFQKERENKNLSEKVTHMSELLEQKDKEYKELEIEQENWKLSRDNSDAKV